MWSYSQSTGELCHDGLLIGTGYSGRDDGKNNPSKQDAEGIGPIPRGRYKIGHPTTTHPHLGKAPVMALTPLSSAQTFGRSGFFMHGDNKNHDASHGCIVMDHGARERVASSGDRDLIVMT